MNELLLVMRIPESFFLINLRAAKQSLAPADDQTVRSGFVLDDPKNERMFYAEFLAPEFKAAYMAALDPELVQYIVEGDDDIVPA